jgi:hypothetical protein
MKAYASLVVLLVLAAAKPADAQIPRTISVQGLLTDDAGNPVVDDTRSTTFRLYATSGGGAAFWTQTKSVSTVDGIYDVILGPIADTVPFDDSYWLSLQVSPDPEMTQRTELTAAPYCLNSKALELPFSVSRSSVNALLDITNTRTGPATAGVGRFVIDNSLNPAAAVYGYTNGTGRGVSAVSAGSATALRAYSSASGRSIYAENGGTGQVAEFQSTNASNSEHVITAETTGSGNVVSASTTGSGHAIDASTSNSGHAVNASTTGGGNAGRFVISNPSNNNAAVYAETNGTSRAGHFRITNAGNNLEAMAASTQGDGPAVSGYTVGTGNAGFFRINNESSDSSAVYAETNGERSSAGHFLATAATGTGSHAIEAEMKGLGHAGLFITDNAANNAAAVYIESSGPGAALVSKNYSTGWAGRFWGAEPTAHGVYISTYTGQTGLQVVNGTKSAVVPTASGARALYSEESSEVWFTDYGFGQLRAGQARISIDRLFAETVNLGEPYHVFVQPNDTDCQGVAVVNKTTTFFEVVELSGGRSSASFSYRIVGKRRGYEDYRLEPAPEADVDPNLGAPM